MYTIKMLICFILLTCSLSACEKDRPREVKYIVENMPMLYPTGGYIFMDSVVPPVNMKIDTTKAIYLDGNFYVTRIYIDSTTYGAYDKFPRHSYWGYAKQSLRMKIDTVRIDTVDWHYGVNTFNFDATIWSGDWWFEPVLRYTIDTSYYLTKEQRKLLEEK